MAAHTSAQQTLYQLRLSKGVRDRIAEDAVASRLIIRALAETDRAFGGAGLDLGLGEVGEGGTGPTEVLKVTSLSISPQFSSYSCHCPSSQKFPFVCRDVNVWLNLVYSHHFEFRDAMVE